MDLNPRRRVDDYLGTDAKALRARGLDRTPLTTDRPWPGEQTSPERILAILGVPAAQRQQLIDEMTDEEILAFPRPAEPGPERDRWVAAWNRWVHDDQK